MKLSQFKFKLPEDKIALHPTKYRDESRLMVLHRNTGKIEHRMFKDVLDYFDDKDVFIFNDTKVFPARLYGNKEKTGARIEVFLLRELNEELRLWDVLVDPARKIRIGNKLYFGPDDSMVAEVIDNTTSRGRTLRFLYDGPHDEFKKALYALGETPLPHSIINRPVEPEDAERFQSIFAKKEGAVTAPTASLHFSRELMKRLEIKGIDFAYITLHAGLGNFRDIDVEDLTKHKMDSEQMLVDEAAVKTVNRAKDTGRNVCAVRTTVMQAIESAVSTDGYLKEFEGWTNNRFIEENIKTGELNKQPVFQIGKPSFSKIRVAVANIQMDISNFDQAVMRKPNRSYRRYQQIAELVNTAVREKADMLVMPEACTPKEWLPTLARTCEKNHLAVVTGVEHIIEDNCVYNLTAVILPYEEKWTGQWHSVILYHSKNHFAPEEKRMIESLHLRAMEGIESSEAKCDAKYELYSWNGFWFTVYCCFELTSIRDRSIFQSYIDAVIAVEWNHDVNYYSNIIESLSRDIHCYCIQTNTSEYGDSRITKPSKTENKDILRIKGGSNATAHVGTIDLEQLREFQMKAYSGQKEDKTFKPTPPDFDYKGAYERRKGTMFECFCAKKKAD